MLVINCSNSFAIRIKFRLNSPNDTLVVGHYYGSHTNMLALDTLLLKKGIGEFKNDTLKSGLYFLYNDKNKHDLLLSSSEKDLIVSYDSSDFFKSIQISGSPIAQNFIEYLKYINEQKQAIKNDSTISDKISKEVNSYLSNLIAQNKSNVLGKFLNFYTPISISSSCSTQEEKFYYLKSHFFDNANIFDSELIYTPLFDEKLTEYYNYLIGSPSDICKDLDSLITRSMSNKETFRYVLIHTLQHYLKSNQVIAENFWVHIAQKWYIPFSSWSDFAYLERLKFQVKARTPNLIGAPAPDFKANILNTSDFTICKTDSLARKDVYQGKEKSLKSILSNGYTLLIFFEADCSHCKEVMPLFYKVFNKYQNKGLQGIIVNNNNTPEGKVDWCDYINTNQMYDWTNCWSPYSNEYKDLYNIISTPTIYLLHGGVIELKNIDSKTLEEYLSRKMK